MFFCASKLTQRRIFKGLVFSSVILGGLSLSVFVSQKSNPYTYSFAEVMPNAQRLVPLENELAFYQERIQQHPDGLTQAALASTYFKMAQATGQSHWYLKADHMAEQSLSTLPHNNQEALLIRARVAEAKHDFPTAIALAKQVLQDVPHHHNAISVLITSYLGQGNIPEADRLAVQLVNQIPTVASYTLRSQVAIAKGNDDEAIRNFQLALAAEESNELGSSEKLRVLWGKFARSRGDVFQSRKLLESALKISPQSSQVLVELANLDKREGHYQAASNRYQQVFHSQQAAHTHDHEAAIGQAELYQLQGKEAEARRFWAQAEHAIRDHGELETFGHQREFAQLLLKRGDQADVNEALELMESEVQRRQDHETLDTLAWALSRQNRWQEALKTLQTAMDRGANAPVMYYRAAAIARQLNQLDLAQQYQTTAQHLDSTIPKTLLALWGIV